MRLKSLIREIDNGQNLSMAKEPLTHEEGLRPGKDLIRENDSKATATGYKEVDILFEK